MPQRKLIYGSILFSTILISLMVRLYANPILYDEMQEKSRDKRSFYDIHCKGIYDKSIFARVDQICEDCYNIFREPKLHSICRQKCFTSDYFKGCVDILRLSDEFDKIQGWGRLFQQQIFPRLPHNTITNGRSRNLKSNGRLSWQIVDNNRLNPVTCNLEGIKFYSSL